PPRTPSTLFPYTTLFRSDAACLDPVVEFGHNPLGDRRLLCFANPMLVRIRHVDVVRRPHDDVEAGGPRDPRQARRIAADADAGRSEEHTSELQSLRHLVC